MNKAIAKILLGSISNNKRRCCKKSSVSRINSKQNLLVFSRFSALVGYFLRFSHILADCSFVDHLFCFSSFPFVARFVRAIRKIQAYSISSYLDLGAKLCSRLMQPSFSPDFCNFDCFLFFISQIFLQCKKALSKRANLFLFS